MKKSVFFLSFLHAVQGFSTTPMLSSSSALPLSLSMRRSTSFLSALSLSSSSQPNSGFGGRLLQTYSTTTSGSTDVRASASTETSGDDSEKDGEEPVEEQGEYTEFSRLEIKVGKILEVERHPDADGLYVEKIDVGEEEPRIIVSGLVKYINKEDFEGMSTLVLCNLKPRAMRGITSAGMVLCASNEDHTEVWPLLAPEGAVAGDVIRVEGHQYKPDPAGNRAGKAFTKVADDLYVNEELEATYKGGIFTTGSGSIKSTMKGSIS